MKNRIGFIFECGPQGADKQICEYLASHLRPDTICVSRTLDNKANLLRDAGRVAAALLADGCERVLVIWDLRPAWPSKANKPCRKHERDALLIALDRAGISGAPVFLVCIEQELESWLLADEGKVSDFLSTQTHCHTVRRVRHPDREANPKAALMKHFRDARNWRYDDRIHAIKIMRQGQPDLSRLRRSPSFCRFENKLT